MSWEMIRPLSAERVRFSRVEDVTFTEAERDSISHINFIIRSLIIMYYNNYYDLKVTAT